MPQAMKKYLEKTGLANNGPQFDRDPVNILIVDDLEEKLLSYEIILEELGQNLVFAKSGEEALRLVLKEDFAVILLDVNMPGMNGLEAASLIRQRKKSSHTPIIFLTAFTDEIRMAQGYASGAVDYLPTPVVPEILRAKVKVFIELSQMRRQAALQAEERALRKAAEESSRRFEFLVAVGEVFARVQNQTDLMYMLSKLPLGSLADRTIVWLSDGEGRHESIHNAYIDENGSVKKENCDDLGACIHSQNIKNALKEVADTGQVLHLSDVPESDLSFSNVPGESKKAINDNGFYTAIVLPILIRGMPSGAAVLSRKKSQGIYSSSDIFLAQELVSRAGIALENARLVEKIKEADKRKDDFLATLAHELRNPLAPINNAINVLKITDDKEILAESKMMIERQVKHMIHLVDDLMDISRITRGKIELRKEEMNLKDIISHAIETSEPLISQRNHELIIRMPEEDIWLHADPSRIAQIFANLLNNAAKYTDNNGTITLSVEREDEEAVIIIRDNGIGIPRDKLEDIFNMFSQVDGSLERAQGGLGIGLTLVRSMVNMHGGDIRAFSDGANLGSKFVTRLPALAARKNSIAAPVKEVKTVLRPLKVLVVDDSEGSAKTLGWMVEFSGHEARLAYDGVQAIELARSYKPDVVLLDIGLPGMNGYDVCKAMHNDPGMKNAIFIAQTGWGQSEHRKLSQEAGFDHHLVKPVDADTLNKILMSIGN